MARQKHSRTPGPAYLDCGHETIAVTMAAAYTHITGRMQAGGAAACRRGTAAGLHGGRRGAGDGDPDAGHVGRIHRLWRERLRSWLAMVSQPERRGWRSAAARASREMGAAGALARDALPER